MLTKFEVSQLIFDYLRVPDVEGLGTLVSQQPSDEEKRAVLEAINAAVQQIDSEAPANYWGREPIGAIVQPPATVTATVAEENTGVTLTGGLDWMVGCSIQINGEPLNRLRALDVLAYPCALASGAYEAKVYCDAVEIPTRVRHIKEPVTLGGRRLKAIMSESYAMGEWYDVDHIHEDYGDVDGGLSERRSGGPNRYYIEALKNPDGTTSRFIRFHALPNARETLKFRSHVKPEDWTMIEITEHAEGDVLNGDVPTGLPAQLEESLLMPLVRQKVTKYFATNNSTEGGADLQTILASLWDEYTDALFNLRNSGVGQNHNRRILGGGWGG